MAWDTDSHPLITRARLLLSPPEVVYQALEEYGAHLAGHRFFGGYDETLERALAKRDDQLINLGLAKNASTNEVVAQLYKRTLEGGGDPEYNKAVRLACLANRVAVGMLFTEGLAGIDSNEFRRLALEGDGDEVTMLMRNPGRRSVLRDVYGRRAPVDDIPQDRWWLLVHSSIGNAGLNEDDSNEHGPDLVAWDIQKALFDLLSSAPVDPKWLRTLYQLLLEVNPSNVKSPNDSIDVREVLDRWKGLKVPKLFSQDGEEQEDGYYTSLSLVDEFRCLVSAYFGRIFVNSKFTYIGDINDPDVVLRCARYGRVKMTVYEMRSAKERDGDVFVLVALLNDQLLLKRECRVELEQMLSRDTQRLYSKRCLQLQKVYQWFEPAPLSDSIVDDVHAEVSSSADAASIKALSAEIVTLKAAISEIGKSLFWGFLIIGAIVLFRH